MQKIFNKQLFLISTIVFIISPLYSVKRDKRTSLRHSVHTYDMEIAQKILSQKSNSGLSSALHNNYALNRNKIIFLLLKSGSIGSNNEDSEGNTLLHKAIIDNRKKFIRKLFNFSGDIPLNVNKKSKKGDAPIHRALDIMYKQPPRLALIKLLTQHPNLNLNLKNRYQQTPLEIARLNLNYFQSNRTHPISKSRKKKNIAIAHATVNHLQLAMDYQKITGPKKNDQCAQFLSNRNFGEFSDIVTMALDQKNQIMLKTINKRYPKIFSWIDMLLTAKLHDSVQSIPFIINQLEITPQETRSFFARIFGTKNNSIIGTKKRIKILNELYEIYRDSPYTSDFKKSMFNHLITLSALHKFFKNNNSDLVRTIIEYY